LSGEPVARRSSERKFLPLTLPDGEEPEFAQRIAEQQSPQGFLDLLGRELIAEGARGVVGRHRGTPSIELAAVGLAPAALGDAHVRPVGDQLADHGESIVVPLFADAGPVDEDKYVHRCVTSASEPSDQIA
jgi:hypothetical protein